jgi:hypothetical protein
VTDGGSLLLGRTVLAAVASPALAAAITSELSTAGMLVGVCCPDPAVVMTLNRREPCDVVAFVTPEPVELETWQRILAAVEQRLGPIDAIINAVPGPSGEALTSAGAPDLTARGGVVIQATDRPVDPARAGPGVRRITVTLSGGAIADAELVRSALASAARMRPAGRG